MYKYDINYLFTLACFMQTIHKKTARVGDTGYCNRISLKLLCAYNLAIFPTKWTIPNKILLDIRKTKINRKGQKGNVKSSILSLPYCAQQQATTRKTKTIKKWQYLPINGPTSTPYTAGNV